MRILTRYVVLEFLKVFVVTLVGTTALMIVVVVAVEAKQQGIGLVQTLRLLPFVLPGALRFAVPGATLFAACNVYGRLSSANELVAAKSLGISPMVFLWPALVLGGMLSVVAVWLNDVAVTWGTAGVQRVVIESVEQIAYGMLRAKKSYSSGKIAMSVKEVEGHTLINPTLEMKGGDGTSNQTITAKTAELEAEPSRGTLIIRFHDVEVFVGPDVSMVLPGEYVREVPLHEFSNKGDRSGRPSNTPLGQISERIRRQQEEIAQLGEQFAATAAFDMMTGNLDQMEGRQWSARRRQTEAAWNTLFKLRTEPHRRWANGASCLCFVLVGAPMAIYRRKGEFLTSFFVIFLPILLIYYPLLMTGVDRAKSGAWPPHSVWLGNLILIVWGGWLLRKVIRY